MANILYVGFYSLPDNDAAANRVLNNAKALREAGHRVLFLDEQQDCVNSLQKTEHVISGFKTWSSLRPNNYIGLLQKMTSIKKVITLIDMVKDINIVIAYNYPSIALIRLIRYCRKRNIKIVSDCTEWYSGKDYSFPMNILSAGDSFLRMRFAQKKIDGIICISSFLCNYYKKNKNVVFVPPLVDTNDSKWNQKKYVFDEHKLNLVYTGNLGKSKEVFMPIVEAIDASSNRQSIILRIVGATREQFLKLCPDAEPKLHRLNDSIEFCGRVSHKESLKILRSSDYIVFIRERNRVTMAGFSTKFVEAVSSGTPVITNNTGDLKYYFQLLHCGYILDDKFTIGSVLNKNILQLKRMKNELIKTDFFDYRNFIDVFGDWVRIILEE